MMPSKPDLNSNLMKSLSSAYLPPPPSQISNSVEQTSKLAPSFSFNQHISSSSLETNTVRPKKSKRRSSTTEELLLPLTTPPHTISRTKNESSLSSRKRNQTTPTLSQPRAKSNQNPISPQYSSPSTSMSEIPIIKPMGKNQSKPPQPSFVVTRSKPTQPKEQPETKVTQPPPRPCTPGPPKEEDEVFELPSPGSMPEIVFDSDAKPPFSYATLIGMAILRGEDRKLTLSQIYSWIATTFKFYRKDELGWQNSIRHNLSLNKAFIKTDKSSDGKGHYWEVVEGHELQFVKGKSGKKVESIKKDVGKKKSQRKSLGPLDVESEDNEQYGDTNTSNVSQAADMKVVSSTPKKQIRSSVYDERPAIKKSNSVIGIQRFPYSAESDLESDYEDDDELLQDQKQSNKRQQLRSISVANGELTNFNLPGDAGLNPWLNRNTSIDDRIQSNDSTSKISFTSSFSSVTNFEMSPIRRKDSGPLLEPLTPSSRLGSFNQPSLNSQTKTPLRNTTNSINGLSVISSTQTNRFHNFLKTPITKTRTPNSNSIMKKFWNSPAFIDDFYTSPSVQRYAIDRTDMISKRLFGSPDTKRNIQAHTEQGFTARTQFFEYSSHFPAGYSDLFGVDIHSVVQRAVEKEKINQQSLRGAEQEQEQKKVVAEDNVSTDDDMEN